MERYRLRYAPKDRRRKLLLALSYGVSSLAVLHILDALLEKQRNTGQRRTAFDLHVFTIDPSTINPNVKRDAGRIDLVRQSYPEYEYTETPLSSIFQYDDDIGSVIAQYAGSNYGDDGSKSNEERLQLFRSSLTTATSRKDLDDVLIRRLIVAFAKSHGCEGVVLGDSDSCLAAKTLAQVSKGRGFSLPWAVSDGLSPSGLHFTFPCREIFKTELEQYADISVPEIRSKLDVQAPTTGNMSSRVMSIDDLMTQYVETQGEKYPGVMANIVRTVDKLHPSPSDAHVLCACCDMPMNAVREDVNAQDGNSGPTCYGCSRSLFDLRSTAGTT